MKSKKFYMAGTEGTGAYIVLAITSRGRVGVRVLAGNGEDIETIEEARIRVEPVHNKPKVLKGMTDALSDWKQPDEDQYRFSTVTSEVSSSLQKALSAIGAGVLQTEVNDNAPEWARSLATIKAA